MNYVGRLISGVKTFYSEINPATLTGAIDVIVVQQPDGSLVCSPFHVRFGKMGVLRSREKIVDIQINGEPVDLYMKLGESGEAFFVEEIEEEDNVPDHLATSPIPTSGNLFKEGMKELHSQRLGRHSRSETESSRESEPPSKTMSSSSLRSSSSQALGKETGVDMQSVGEKLRDISMEASGSGKAKEKKLTKTKNSLKTLQDVEDVEAGSSQEEDVSSKLEQRLSGSSPLTTESITIESESKANNSRSRIRAKRRRRRSGKGGKVEKTLPQNSNVRRVASMSESSTSSSQHSDEELEGIFPIDDVEGDEGNEEEDEHQVDRPVSLVADEFVSQEWNNLTTPTQRPFHVFSDGDYTPIVSPQATRPSTPKSDTEADHLRQSNLRQANKAAGIDKFEWNWGELPEQPLDGKSRSDSQPSTSPSSSSTSQGKAGEEKKSSIWSKIFSSKNEGPREEGMYLQDLASEEVDPEVYALYFPESSQVPANRIKAIQEAKDEDKSSDLGNSLPQSPNTVMVSDSESHHSTTDSHHSASDLQQSMDSGQGCLDTHENLREMQLSLCGGLKEDEDTIEIDHFKKHLITYEEFIKDPSMLTNPKLVIRINNKFFNWQMAGPVIISQLAFQKPLPDVASNLMKENLPKGRKSLTSWFWGSSPKPSTPKKELPAGSYQDDLLIQQIDDERMMRRKNSMESGPNSADEMEMTGGEKSQRMRRGTERYKKAIRLSSEQLAKLNLQPGPNEIRYSVTTRYQGTSVCECTIYYWNYNTKIIISDIDGTITKSDVFGQILPMVGKDWTHIGVAQLYSNIKLNGYNFLYLSSRAIGQARLTKGYLNSIQQDKASLPDGPLLLNPSSLFQAFHSEVIIRKPEEFKIKCLKDIESLFPANNKPFYAGYGNRINDTWAYRAVGIPVSRIFTINPQGKITHEMTKSFQSSYPRMKDLADHVFPPLHRQTRMAFDAPAEYSGFTYWRSPLPNLAPDDDLLSPP
ncbi:phosphatidate phosphatase LPIN2 isoform X2 [Strongylocentrotus purpuratus]|uniref:phosphatidate phosphatase n=1 Tax=Strongylocentrotus purpuratus TaxID=7668 RepID=A0A7M7HBJ1_STRPU|nr:phosphatidate phosphatase LPIN2 isoform X2 [Strongylocentrotus purpuratus]|eukprot:XP_011660379.1 PREDICTED: phosphatidate phosphatase LPIN2 isoform X2 [Strongylocentrotus purpuratus]